VIVIQWSFSPLGRCRGENNNGRELMVLSFLFGTSSAIQHVNKFHALLRATQALLMVN